jgi:TonB family protein
MNGYIAIDDWGRGQNRLVRWMIGLSLLFHAVMVLLGFLISSYFPPREPVFPVVTVELTEAPLSTLPEEKPVPPPSPSVPPKKSVAARPLPVPAKKAQSPSASQRWLRKLDKGLPSIPDAPVAKGMGKPGGIPVRRWANDASPRPGDFAPAVAPENSALRGQISRLEGKVRQSGVAGVGTGKEIDASVMFGGVGSSQGEPIPEWIRDMIRRKVLGYLPELEDIYSAAYRRNPDLRGRLVVRFQIDPSGKVTRADSVESSIRDSAFITRILEKVRRWTFEPTEGRTVQVLYPFVFIAPS